ncbi:deoxycytidine triphosphate deaminase [Rhizobium lusitanum]|uniref:Deoxycytidine triphosphate deaminase n=1 Tax=Rhizobium lusitanum TaxID=293958 RepID=A0A6L9UA94_9HYPH|nr:deoxycytidine triphosphate deaminase [Rhizobium lusitanum]NEI71027.1 deoxycytidine triphosphate deaminase [Rhizobium lusitanum]
MILPAQAIRAITPPIVRPFRERGLAGGMSFGLSVAGYDVRIAEDIILAPGEFKLASTLERFEMPLDVLGQVADKSTWARRGLAVQNTIIEPGWRGFLTLELTNHQVRRWRHILHPRPDGTLVIERGMPIAQIIFMRLEAPAERGYSGKYQNQEPGPQAARDEGV